MRVAMLGWEFPPFTSGGLGVHCFELTRALCRMGVEIDFFMPVTGKRIQSPHKGMRIIEVAETTLRPYLHFSKSDGKTQGYGDNLIRAVNEYWDRCVDSVTVHSAGGRYDVIHAHDWLTSRAGLRLKERLGVPLVQTFHSTEFDRTSWPWDYILDVERSAAESANLIIAVSRRTKQQVMRLGAPEGKIHVIYNGVDRERFAAAQVDNNVLESLKKKKKVVLFLGRLTEQKGPVQFLHAAKRVLSVEPDVLFVVAGKGELLPLLINMTLDLGISQNVRFLGYVPDEDQQRIYKLADVYVMPSTSEPFGITALEAMSSGVPVIISKTSGVAEIVKSAIKVDFWDINAMATKIIAVLRHRPLASAMTRMSSAEVSQYTWARTAEETLLAYRQAMGNK
jgi:glycogen synthase